MRPEVWASLGAGLLLAAAATAQGLALFNVKPGWRRWELLAVGTRVGGVVALAVNLALAILAHGEWSASDLHQVTLGLALATLFIHTLVTWPSGIGHAGPVADMVVLALLLVDAFIVRPGGPLLSCAQRAIPYQAGWALFLLGSGGAVVAGSAALRHRLYLWAAGRGWNLWPQSAVNTAILQRQVIALSLLCLGSGIVVSTWWAWRALGSLSDDDPRVGWMAITWLVAAMSEVAWRLDRHPTASDITYTRGRWALWLAAWAAAAAILGLLAVADLRRLLGG